MTPAGWYYAKGQDRIGPLLFTELQQLASGGTLQPTDMVWQPDASRWAPASVIPGLFSSNPWRKSGGVIFLGWATLLASTVFACALIFTLVQTTWYSTSTFRSLAGFFGFGIPALVLASVAGFLGHGNRPLTKTLGWASVVVSLVCAVCLFMVVFGIVKGESVAAATGITASLDKPAWWQSIWHVISFAIVGGVSGGAGVIIVKEDDAPWMK